MSSNFVLYSIPQLLCLIFQALYHALPMNYVTVAKLQSKLEGEANQTIVRKIINKMTLDGFLEAKGSRRLGLCSPIGKFVLGLNLQD